FLQAPTVRAFSNRVQAKGFAGPGGAGGDGRIRVDAAQLELDGVSQNQAGFAAGTSPATGYFGNALPVIFLPTPGTSSLAVAIPYQVADSDGNAVSVEAEFSLNGGGTFQPAHATS